MSEARMAQEDLAYLASCIAMEMQNNYKSKAEICSIYRVSPTTLNAWIDDGLKVVRYSAKHVRIDVRDVEAYLNSKKQ